MSSESDSIRRITNKQKQTSIRNYASPFYSGSSQKYNKSEYKVCPHSDVPEHKEDRPSCQTESPARTACAAQDRGRETTGRKAPPTKNGEGTASFFVTKNSKKPVCADFSVERVPSPTHAGQRVIEGFFDIPPKTCRYL